MASKKGLKIGDTVYVPGVFDPNDPNYLARVQSIHLKTGKAFIANTNMPYNGSVMQWFPISELSLAGREVKVRRVRWVYDIKRYPDRRKRLKEA